MSSRSRAFLAIIIASVLWGTAGVTAKTLVKGVDPFVASFYRFLIASLLILPFFLKEKRVSHHVWRDLFPLSLIGALNVPFFYLGIKTTTANSATAIYTAIPLTTALFSYILIKETHSRKKLIGICIGLIGALLITFLPFIEKGNLIMGDFMGNLFVVCAMLSWTLYSIGSHRILIKNRYPPLTVTSMYFFASASMSLLLSVLSNRQLIPPNLFMPTYIAVLLYSSIFITLIPYFLFQWASKRVSITTVSLKQYVELIAAVFLNSLLLGEILSGGFIIGTLLVVLGVIIATGTQILSAIKRKLLHL
ncbi:MAG: hypothetical protein UV63_C0021G0004 [Microgenomates group bacterium GW2011_GWC1_43_11]|uniref:EamA domain-containing protein n=2 Tax=Candidatus Gottesmaniibacteriota TaxID=1752720 RepID=A0A0G1KW24_9BACT|nr:MAG: hypothetical protein UV63_C0021G0004 [Microgenomates group bacterium GW2011_GWC1_43_11]KKT37676.1 MAG: hypothetical protein UW22_C0020G0013 [Candidatus Gottesmanbacteria bacterium GW2011_GWB1_44_11c]KKT60532.1 MAG: hypothetical protein UW52_C0024G0002 [Candidatus Gottesmanbacteria bacterium GW2011_GWA1_44_24b]HCM82489.1 hypothetical protein [Patescibacteria group bacterium]